MGIPPYDFRDWESNEISGKPFKETAKFVSLDGDVVTLERADGSTATIDFMSLRGSDKAFIRHQAECFVWGVIWLDWCKIVARLILNDEPIIVLELEGHIIHRGAAPQPLPADREDVEQYLHKFVREFGREYFATEAGPGATVTETTIDIPIRDIRIESEIYPLPEPASRWKTVLLVNGAIICAMLALYFYLRWRKSLSAS